MRAPPESFKADHRRAVAHGQIHDLADFLRVRFGERSAEDREVLSEDVNQRPSIRPKACQRSRRPLAAATPCQSPCNGAGRICPDSSKVPSSSSRLMRSRAVSFAGLVFALAALSATAGLGFRAAPAAILPGVFLGAHWRRRWFWLRQAALRGRRFWTRKMRTARCVASHTVPTAKRCRAPAPRRCKLLCRGDWMAVTFNVAPTSANIAPRLAR
jgi:hypothetical protein